MQFAARFAMRASFSMTEMGRKLLPEFDVLSKDEMWGEFRKMLEKGIKPSCGLKFLTASWWILKFPEILDLMGLEQDPERHPEGSVFCHTFLAVDCAANICMRDKIEGDDRVIAVLAALCHDFGKATTTEFLDGKWCSRGHDKAGEAPARAFCERIGAPKAITEAVVAVVVEHMCHLGVDESNAARIARRLAVRLDGKVSASILAIVMEADHMARGSASSGMPDGMRLIVAEMEKAKIEDSKPKNLLTGEMLISLGLKPGKLFGELQRRCYELQLDGHIKSAEEAREWAWAFAPATLT
jgi:tRNA nucleotidyltransferase (CCA-adding enzyme)